LQALQQQQQQQDLWSDCITCKPIVEKKLIDEQAIKKIDIDQTTDSVVVRFDLSLITKEEIKNRL
jgi:copper chaperone